MKPEYKQQLFKKGWTQGEMRKAESILERKDFHNVFFSKIVFWSALLVIIIGNILVSLVLIPFLFFLEERALYIIVAILAFMIGALYNFLITDIEYLERKHHVMASILVPLFAVINFILVTVASNNYLKKLGDNVQHNPWVISLLFAVVFMIPFLWNLITTKKRE